MAGAVRVEREAARAIVFEPGGAVLLQEIQGDSGRSWILPGGGPAEGETQEVALARELAEEVGLMAAEIGPCVWRRTAEFRFRGVEYRQRERFYVVRADRFEFDHSGLVPEEVGLVLGHRWWELEEIEAATDTVFWPRGLAEHLRLLVHGPLPKGPVELTD